MELRIVNGTVRSLRLIILRLKLNLVHSRIEHVVHSKERRRKIIKSTGGNFCQKYSIQITEMAVCGVYCQSPENLFSSSLVCVSLILALCSMLNAHHSFPFRLIRNASVNAFHDVRSVVLAKLYNIFYIAAPEHVVYLEIIVMVIVAIILLDVSLRQRLCVTV